MTTLTKHVQTPGTSRQEAKVATRAKVLEAARRLFEFEGYEFATIRDIALEAGMSTGAVFANFSGKAALYREIYGHDPISPEAGRELLAAATKARDACAKTVAAYGQIAKQDSPTGAFSHGRSSAAEDIRSISGLDAAIARATSDPSETRQNDEASVQMRGAA
jgi:AcrR family transcriptional regulator